MKYTLPYELAVVAAFFMLVVSCEKQYFPQPPPVKTAKETNTLEATYRNTPPITLADAYWKTADYLKVPVTDLNTNALYPDGFLNMTGTYGGKSTFNKGEDPKVVMKAAYDKNKVYIYIEWIDSDISPALEAALFDGPSDPLKSDPASEWTSQGNSDKVALAFDIANATSSAGTFIDKGCAASCHLNKMRPATGSVDIWNWDLAISEPMGYARDMSTDGISGLSNDAGLGMHTSNKTNARSRPIYEWDGSEQTLTRPDGKTTILDPAFFLLNKSTFIGDMEKGEKAYHHADYGCGHCHGENGEGHGISGEGTAFASTGFAGKYSRASIKSYSANELHTGLSYWQQVPVGVQDDLIAFIKGLGGIPGNYLSTPTGSNANIWSVSNVVRSRINTNIQHTVYKVLLIRDLTTGNADDVQFASPQGKTFVFGIAFMDNDGSNHIGSLKQILTFKTN